MEDPSGRYLVLGLGRSGEAVVRFLADRVRAGAGLTVAALDSRDTAVLRAKADALRALGVEVRLGVSDVGSEADVVVTSPGIAPSTPLLASALGRGMTVLSEVEFASRLARAPIAAVTGTNGKTTTTCLLTHLLNESGIPARAAGNIGDPLIDAVVQAGEATVLVAEVSSFQLEFTSRFAPRVSVLLNITPDHLDWHPDMDAYTAAKGRVFANQGPDDTAVIDVDDRGARSFAREAEERGVRVCRVSLEHLHPGGASLVDGVLTVDGPRGPVALVHRSELRLRGSHNLSNALAASAAALALGADASMVIDGLRSFRPVEHRIEPVAVVAGVECFNDSKATNPDAALKALAAFEDEPVVMMLGGRNKGVDLRPLAEECAARCKAVVLFGDAAPEFRDAFSGLDVELREAPRLAGAVDAAAAMAAEGDVVLLSPACTSFDEFTGYDARGAEFKRLVFDRAAV